MGLDPVLQHCLRIKERSGWGLNLEEDKPKKLNKLIKVQIFGLVK